MGGKSSSGYPRKNTILYKEIVQGTTTILAAQGANTKIVIPYISIFPMSTYQAAGFFEDGSGGNKVFIFHMYWHSTYRNIDWVFFNNPEYPIVLSENTALTYGYWAHNASLKLRCNIIYYVASC